MRVFINNINSDRENVVRHITTILKSPITVTHMNSDRDKLSEYQRLSSKYQSRLKKLLSVITSDSDIRLVSINTQLNELVTYFNGVVDMAKVTTSEIVLNDVSKVVIQFMETKFSDLLKIDLLK